MSVSSKFGLKIGAQDIFELKSPNDALELCRAVVAQFMGESFTTYRPRCPICDSALCDHEKHMNKPVGECTNEKCDSTIHAADYMGKLLDILAEWDKCKDDWEDRLRQLIANQHEKKTILVDDDDDDDDYAGHFYDARRNAAPAASAGTQKVTVSNKKGGGFTSDEDFIEQIDGVPVFLW